MPSPRELEAGIRVDDARIREAINYCVNFCKGLRGDPYIRVERVGDSAKITLSSATEDSESDGGGSGATVSVAVITGCSIDTSGTGTRLRFTRKSIKCQEETDLTDLYLNLQDVDVVTEVAYNSLSGYPSYPGGTTGLGVRVSKKKLAVLRQQDVEAVSVDLTPNLYELKISHELKWDENTPSLTHRPVTIKLPSIFGGSNYYPSAVDILGGCIFWNPET